MLKIRCETCQDKETMYFCIMSRNACYQNRVEIPEDRLSLAQFCYAEKPSKIQASRANALIDYVSLKKRHSEKEIEKESLKT